VTVTGDVVNWHTGEPDAPAVGGAMDLAIGAKDVYVMMTLFTKTGEPKLVPACTYPLTGVGCVSRVYTDLGVFDLTPEGAVVRETYGVSLDELWSRLSLPQMP
jgi:3-oxoadipate CoA-transferase beta subunit